MTRNFLRERHRQLVKDLTTHSGDLVQQILPIVESRGRLTQGMVIAELMAIWLASQDDQMREGLLKILVETALLMVMIHDKNEDDE